VTGEPGEALSQRRLNRSLLARQLLLERSTLPIPAVLDQLVGIQNQYAPNAYIRLWSCVEGFQRDDLTRAYEQGSVVQGTLMRGTIHTVSPGDYHPMVAAVRASRRDWAEKIHRQSAADRDELIARVRSAVGGRTLTRAELVELRAGASDAAWQTIDTDAELLRVPPSGTWERRRADVFGLADDVIGRHDELPEADGLAPVARRYLAGFGPASVGDVASFIGMPVTPLKPILASLELRRYRDEAGRELLDVADGPLPDADTPAPVRFLPTWDATLLVHARRTQILPEVYRPRIFHTKMPPSYPTFLVDGQVAGTWRFEDGHVVLDPFATVARGDRRALDEEAERLAAFHA
jgi:hypothetical protein